ncbi:hypothetical protein ATCC90586_009765 [Pythium insidiosum]|nr:hypothetical protein ATCC90586_009765 [Pythium insidiosum]
MGQVCSGGSVGKQVDAVRDADDRELDAVEMKEVKIPEYDSFFESASGPLNEMVEIHNGILLSEENLKEAAAAIQGETQLRLIASGSGRVSICLWRYDEKEREQVLTAQQVEETIAGNKALREAYEHAQHAIDSLNAQLEKGGSNSPRSRFEVKRGRLHITSKGSQDRFVRDVNITLFSLRKQMAILAHVMNLSDSMKIFLKEVSKVQDISSLNVQTNEEGAIRLASGDDELDLHSMNKLSKPALQFRDALVSLLENIEMASESMPQLVEQTNSFISEAQEFPSKVPDAAASAGLGFTEIPKAAMATGSNVKSLSAGPTIASSTMDMMKYVATELALAVSAPIGAVAKSVHAARDPEDKELEEVEMKEVKIPDFDGFFERAAAPLNEMVEIHNGIFLSEEALKEAAAALQGETMVRVSVDGSGRVEMCFWRFDEKENEEVLTTAQVEEKLDASLDLRDAHQRTLQAIQALHAALDKGANAGRSQYGVKRGRLMVSSKGPQDSQVRDVNIALFSLRKYLAVSAHVTNLSESVKIFLNERSKVQDVRNLSVETADDGSIKIMNGDKEFDLRWMDNLSKPMQMFRDALVDLLENVQTAATSVPELVEQSNAFVAEAQEFPSKVPEAASSAGLGMTEIPKAALATAGNVKSLSQGPHIAASTTAMMKYAATELTEAVRSPLGT